MENTMIKLNKTHSFDINSFSRNTSVQDGKLVSSAYIVLKDPDTLDISDLRGLALDTITDLELTVDAKTVLSEEELTARITSIEESLGDDGKMRVSCYIYF